MLIKLTICIPVYNCAAFLGQALDSILPQAKEGVEVVVYDGGSTDATPVLMECYTNLWANLHYHRGSERGGIDADMATCVEFAQGKYCWLFSGDDVMRPGAIECLFEWLKQEKDVYICRHTICNKNMVISHEHPVLSLDQTFSADFINSGERLEWFRRAATTEAFFSFISGIIVRREKWQSGELPVAFSKSCWGHVARLFGLAASGLKVCYVAEVWLDQRGENDSFADKGIVNRFRIGIEGYHRLADTFFGHESEEAFHVRRVIQNEFGLKTFMLIKIQCMKYPIRESRQELDRLVRMTYCDSLFIPKIKCFIYFGTPYFFLGVLRALYQPVKWMRRLLHNA
ncbi:glycosyltransferase family 2 protein [Herminiimonas fonticola]|uniref:Abequosyltransferase n=1 Tax=Herminiimonas fonticola TaxID=303380 RepID=A0A4R6G882_9BURK|nr:glycosyltransferase family 2 protein [Herminiimonas fonticola]RBA24015.1 Glycosyl transferase family 2 [Herminiimonas fonticola]TDN90014.1 abequosyltransferase [Herminiimonas fonticola]